MTSTADEPDKLILAHLSLYAHWHQHEYSFVRNELTGVQFSDSYCLLNLYLVKTLIVSLQFHSKRETQKLIKYKMSSIAKGSSKFAQKAGCLKNLAAIFFDLDNTLIPTRKGDSKACRKVRNVNCIESCEV